MQNVLQNNNYIFLISNRIHELGFFLSSEYVVLVVYLHDLRYITVCVCMYEYYLYKSYGSFFMQCLRVHRGIRHKKITLLDDSVRVGKLGLMNICHEQRIFFILKKKKPAVLISYIMLSLYKIKKNIFSCLTKVVNRVSIA